MIYIKRTPLLIGLMISLTTGFTACSNSEDIPEGNKVNGKSPIVLASSVETNYPQLKTRALGDGSGSELRFSAATEINIFFKSNKLNGSNTDVKMKDPSSATVTTTPISETEGEPKTKVTYATNSEYYWDDFYGRDAQLSIYAVGVEGKKATDLTGNTLAIDTVKKGLDWKLSATQTSGTYSVEDLLLSNNIQKTGDTDSRLKYNSGFPTGHLYFRHALSKIIVNVKKGTGVASTDLVDPTLKVNNFYTEGFLNVTTGAFNVTGKTVADITPIRLATANNINETTKADYSYECLVIPSRDMDVANQIFTLTNTTTNNNTYNISTNLFNKNSNLESDKKLTGNIEPGKQYIFNITVNKSGIELTASKMDWNTQTPDGLTPLIVKGSGIGSANIGTVNNPTSFDFYRSTSKATGYDANTSTAGVNYATHATYDATNGYTMSPVIYWPNHETSYYYRGLCELDEKGTVTTNHVSVVTADNKDYVAIKTCKEGTKSGTYVKDGTDICMGAPYTKSEGTNPTITLTEAKKAGDGDINMTFYHGLAEIYVQLLTNTADDATNQITLENAVVEIENSITDGKYFLENAQVTAGTTRTAIYSMGEAYKSTEGMKLPDGTKATDNVYRCYVVPQSLNYDTNKHITLKITTTEVNGTEKKTNTYYVDTRNATTGSTFTEWKAGNQYLYKVTLLKSGISVTATLLPWTVNTITNDNVIL